MGTPVPVVLVLSRASVALLHEDPARVRWFGPHFS